MTNKKLSKLLAVISILLVIFLAQFFSLMEMLEKYGDLDFSGRKEHKLKPVKLTLPSHGWEKLLQIFFITTRTITGKARIIQPAASIQPTEEALKKRESAEKILQAICSTP